MKVRKYHKGYRNKSWTNYDISVAKCHEANYGMIYVDEYGSPVDDEYLLEGIATGEIEVVA